MFQQSGNGSGRRRFHCRGTEVNGQEGSVRLLVPVHPMGNGTDRGLPAVFTQMCPLSRAVRPHPFATGSNGRQAAEVA